MIIHKEKYEYFDCIASNVIFCYSYCCFTGSDAATRNFYSYVYVSTSAGPRGVGVSEQMLLVAWTQKMPPDTGEILGVVSSPTGRAGWYGMQVKVWDPDNETTTVDMPYSDPVGANWVTYTPNKVGTYRVQAIFPRTDKELKTSIVSGGSTYVAGDHYIYSAAVSPIMTFEVSAEATQSWIESPLPNDYWTRPISGASRQW